MNYAIPGFQTPTSPRMENRVQSNADGSVDFPFANGVPMAEKMPKFIVYIGADRGEMSQPMATAPTTKFIYEKPEGNGTKSYWFRMRPDELTFTPGTYNIRFVLDGKEVAMKTLTVLANPASPKLAPDNSIRVGD